MIYNFNLGIGWASSGVEYAQSYRAKLLREINKPARFIFTDMFPRDNLIDMTRNIGFKDEEIIWLYTFFTDYVPEEVTYQLSDLKETISGRPYTYERDGKIGRIIFENNNNFYRVYFVNTDEERVHRVEMVSDGCLIRKDYFMSGRVFSEYYGPLDNTAHLYQCRFFNRDGSVAYEEIIDDDVVMYKFKDKIICSKEELIGYMTKGLQLTREDIVIIDRSTGQGQQNRSHLPPWQVGFYCLKSLLSAAKARISPSIILKNELSKRISQSAYYLDQRRVSHYPSNGEKRVFIVRQKCIPDISPERLVCPFLPLILPIQTSSWSSMKKAEK